MSEKKGKGSKMKKLLLGFVSIIVSIVVAAMSAAYIAEFKNIMDDIINSGELESIVQDAVDSSIDDLETMEPDAEENKLSGIWLINDALSFTDEMFDENVEFVSNSVAYSRFVVIDARIYYETDANSSGYTNMIYDGQMTTEFTDNSYRYVDFGDIPQSVSEEFYNWLIANADQVGYVSGVWTFNDTLPLFENGDSIEYDIAFTSNGKSYTFIECYNTPGPVGDVTMNYYVEKTGIVGPDSDNAYDSGWANDDYRLVDFGSIPQFVSEEFYTWLTANATQQ